MSLLERKRLHRDDAGETAYQDDLAVAATFAQVPNYEFQDAADSLKTIDQHSDIVDAQSNSETDDSSVEEPEDQIDSSASDLVRGQEDGSNVDEGDDVDHDEISDDESEVDLTHALARMVDDDGDIGAGNSVKLQRPRTEHEVDPYSTPLEELQSNFQLNLTVEEEEYLRLSGAAQHSTLLRLCPAGHISCHMVEERTIVVESSEKQPLDEGSLLLIRVNDDEKMRLLPLGKVFEVFGPISRPLYAIRLPPSPSEHLVKKKKIHNVSQDKRKSKAADENEIVLSESEDGETPLDDDKKEPKPEKTCEELNGNEERGARQMDALQQGQDGLEKELDRAIQTPCPVDDWSAKGAYTAILAASPRQTVYYIENEAKLLDTFAILKNSRKGCDASNLFDEEVLNANDIYFSDDEEERQFKSKKKQGSQLRNHSDYDGQRRIPGFHTSTPSPSPIPPPPPPRAASHGAMPPQAFNHNAWATPWCPLYPPARSNPYQYPPIHSYHHPYSNHPVGEYIHPQVGQHPVPYPYPPPPDTTEESDTVYYS